MKNTVLVIAALFLAAATAWAQDNNVNAKRERKKISW